MTKAKYYKGPKIETTQIVVNLILDGKCLFEGEKAQNAAWLANQSLHQLDRAVKRGWFHYALPVGGSNA